MQFESTSRTLEVKKAAAKYGNNCMRELVDKSFGYQAHTSGDRLVLERTINAADLVAWYAKHSGSHEAQQAGQMPGVANAFGKALNDTGREDEDGAGFYGMSTKAYLKELSGETQKLQKLIEKAQEELARTGIQQALEESMVGMRKRRKRCTSEHDGEWSMDRRWDSHPFLGTLFAKREFPFVEVIYPVGMNCTASAETIAKFNARCLALCEVLENAGYRVSITPECWGTGVFNASVDFQGKAYKSYEVYDLGRFPTREANEYGDIKSFSVIACAEFFRRAIFAGHLASHGYVHGMPGQTVYTGLGRAEDTRPIPAVPGQLVLDRSTVDKIFTLGKDKANDLFAERMRHVVGAKEEYKAS